MTISRKIKIILFFTATIHTLLYVLFIVIINKENELHIQFNNYKKSPINKILFMGDSHVVRSLDVSMIDSSNSLAFYGENNMMNYFKLNFCLNNHLSIPEYLVLPCDNLTFSKGFNEFRTNKYFYYSLLSFKDVRFLNKNIFNAYYDFFKTKALPYIDWQYALNKVNENRHKKANNRFSDKSIIEQHNDARHVIQDELLIGDYKTSFYDENALLFLNKIIDLCKKNKIKLIFVKFPQTKVFLDETKLISDSSFVKNRPSEKIILHESLPILNFEYLYVNNPELFFDSHHLNNIGKHHFTPIIKRSLDSLYKVY